MPFLVLCVTTPAPAYVLFLMNRRKALHSLQDGTDKPQFRSPHTLLSVTKENFHLSCLTCTTAGTRSFLGKCLFP